MTRLRSLRSASIQTRLIVIVLLFAIGVAALAALASARMEGRILTERKHATKSVVETALGVVSYYGAEREAGRMSEKDAQAAALAYFDKPASALTRREAALLAAILPNPRAWSPSRPTAYLERRARTIRTRIEQLGPMLDCVRPI